MSNMEETTVVDEVTTEITTEETTVQEPTTTESKVPQARKNKRRRVKVTTEAPTASSHQCDTKPIGHSGKLSYRNS